MPQSDAAETLQPPPSAATSTGTPGGKKPYVGPLASLVQVRRELARVYKDSRTGKLATADGYRLSAMLQHLGKLIEGSDLEARVAALEAEAAESEP